MKKSLILTLGVLAGLSVFAVSASAAITDTEWRSLQTAGQGYYVEGLSDEEFDALEETTIIKDPDSITGYTVTFRYKDPDASRVRICGEWQFSTKYGVTRDHIVVYEPDEWTPDMFPMNPEFQGDWETYEMELNEETGVWSYTIPLPCGTWSYHFIVGGAEGTEVSDTTDALICYDPNNLPFQYDDDYQDKSQVRVPFDPEKQVNDYSYELPKTEGEIGLSEIVTYPVTGLEDVEDGEYELMVYLPYGYDEDREEPYKVLYVSHGSGHESATSWYNKASLAFVLDDLIASGTLEPTVCVFINNSQLTGVSYNLENFGANVIPYVEENYNVCTEDYGRGICGLSAGGGYTRDIMLYYPEYCNYYGTFSGSANGIDFDLDMDELSDAKLFVSIGTQEFMCTEHFTKRAPWIYRLTELGFPFDFSSNSGGHQWTLWIQDFIDFCNMTLWK